MATATVTLATKSQSFPAGTTPGSMNFLLYRAGIGAGAVVVNPPFASPIVATFPGLTDGIYTGLVRRVSTSSAPLGSDVAFSFTIAAQAAVMVDVPDSVSVVVS